MNRQEAVAKLLWTKSGQYELDWEALCKYCNKPRTEHGDRFNECEPLNLQNYGRFTRGNDWPSTVAVISPPEQYTDEELEKLVAFSERRTAVYDGIFSVRLGMNLITIGHQKSHPDSSLWYRSRASWVRGSFWSKTLDEAMAVFEKP